MDSFARFDFSRPSFFLQVPDHSQQQGDLMVLHVPVGDRTAMAAPQKETTTEKKPRIIVKCQLSRIISFFFLKRVTMMRQEETTLVATSVFQNSGRESMTEIEDEFQIETTTKWILELGHLDEIIQPRECEGNKMVLLVLLIAPLQSCHEVVWLSSWLVASPCSPTAALLPLPCWCCCGSRCSGATFDATAFASFLHYCCSCCCVCFFAATKTQLMLC